MKRIAQDQATKVQAVAYMRTGLFTEDTPTRVVLVRRVLGAIAQFEKASLVAKLKAARDRNGRLVPNSLEPSGKPPSVHLPPMCAPGARKPDRGAQDSNETTNSRADPGAPGSRRADNSAGLGNKRRQRAAPGRAAQRNPVSLADAHPRCASRLGAPTTITSDHIRGAWLDEPIYLRRWNGGPLDKL
jgi:hypothetical protein